MAEPPPDPRSAPPTDIDHEQLRKRAAPAFDDVSVAVRAAVERARDALGGIGGWSTDEEVDRAFIEWYAPKRNEMLTLIAEFAEVYTDVADGLLTMQNNVATVEWGIIEDLNIKDVPVYEWPEEGPR
ncbi:hypothetical protein [Nonomuraea sp. LPB2021202275-12-8]|uniref:hypothetical protein n=1 Tax=Nonomuraea sp. LPB2021202275-12-8 TaxID=3120159 RepID=UPI00300D2A85